MFALMKAHESEQIEVLETRIRRRARGNRKIGYCRGDSWSA
jgi:hypothetical protein